MQSGKVSLLSIGDVAKRTGTNVSAVRFYADQGLIPVSRSNSGHRVFARAVIRRVSFILIAQNLGYSLKQVRQALDSLPDKRTPTKADWARLSNAFSKKIEQQILIRQSNAKKALKIDFIFENNLNTVSKKLFGK